MKTNDIIHITTYNFNHFFFFFFNIITLTNYRKENYIFTSTFIISCCGNNYRKRLKKI
jgi:hypothetical protein